MYFYNIRYKEIIAFIFVVFPYETIHYSILGNNYYCIQTVHVLHNNITYYTQCKEYIDLLANLRIAVLLIATTKASDSTQ